jgi:shikimate kinase/3-dehydroquinate synthase
VVWLDVDADTAWARVAASDRPLARDLDAFTALHAERVPVYDGVARAVITSAAPDTLVEADAALRALAAAPTGIRMAWGAAASGSYPAFVGPGALAIDPPGVPGRRVVVTDETVGALHAGLAGEMAGLIEIPPGEEHKTLETTERVWQAMVSQGLTRGDHLLALGGGVVGDLAGFAAACFQRGIAVVQAPTTVVSQVDSAYGGKTGVDLPQAKNYVGAYHQPACVLADTSTLATLPPEEHAAGYAEVVKTALIAGGPLWEAVSSGAPVDEAVIFGCVRTKLAVVAADERDGGRRQVLNLGHTVGHALETVLGYGTLRHGEAVGLGLLCALRLSGQDELRDHVRELLAANGLPTSLAEHPVDTRAVMAAIDRDKKRVGDGPTPFVLVHGPGAVQHGAGVDAADVEAAVRELAS